MIDERTEELASLYAFDLLEGADRAAFEARLANDRALQALVRDLRESASLLAHTAGPAAPPPELKQRLLAQIEEKRAAPKPTKVVLFSGFALIPWLAAACFAVAGAWLATSWLTSREEAIALRSEVRLLELKARETANRLEAERIILNEQIAITNRQLGDTQRQLADNTTRLNETTRQLATTQQRAVSLEERIADATRQLADAQRREANLNDRIASLRTEADIASFRIATLTSKLNEAPGAVAVAVFNPARQEGILSVSNLPELGANEDYQLWVVDEANPTAPVDGGVFTVDPATGERRIQFRPDKPVKAVAAFAVSRERKGGVPKAEGPIVLLGK